MSNPAPDQTPDQTPAKPKKPLWLTVAGVIAVLFLIGTIANALGIGSDDDGHLSTDDAVERVDTAFGDCLWSADVTMAGAEVAKLPKGSGYTGNPSAVTLTDGAVFIVGVAKTKGAIPANDQAHADLDAGEC